MPANKLEYKYKHEIHCNEVAILPYYVANLNIELTYKQKMGKYEEFQNICFVDTLDHTSFEGKQGDLFALSVENTERIKRQNDKTISVIIGNPPYNANQENENDNNKNREYIEVDKQIKSTYIKFSKAQKTKLYDMYTRFFRWATNRLDENGILAFITNSSFIDTKNFDGFRKVIADEFDEIYIIDLGGDVRKNPKLSGTKHNVFGIQTGVAISFLIKKTKRSNSSPCKIYYARRLELDTSEQKIQSLREIRFPQISFQHIYPDKNSNWINLGDNNFDDFISIADKKTKFAKLDLEEQSVFKLYSPGISTNRDEWMYDFKIDNLLKKSKFFCDAYNLEVNRYIEVGKPENIDQFVNDNIKWSRNLKSHLKESRKLKFDSGKMRKGFYRPFTSRFIYLSEISVDELGRIEEFIDFGTDSKNPIICISIGKRSDFGLVATTYVPSLDIYLPNAAQCLPLYRYDTNGDRIDNITDWGLNQFQTHYSNLEITKLDIFHYVYAVLHHREHVIILERIIH